MFSHDLTFVSSFGPLHSDGKRDWWEKIPARRCRLRHCGRGGVPDGAKYKKL